MGSVTLELLGLFLAVNGLLCVILTCTLPLWKVPAFVGANIVTAQQTWEGLWMDCMWQSTGMLVCSTFDSVLSLGRDLQLARALTTTAGVLGALGILLGITGASWTKLLESAPCKGHAVLAAGFLFLAAGLLQLIPVASYSSNIVRDFHSTSVPDAVKRELGPSLYIGMAAAVLFVASCGLLWGSCYLSRRQRTATHYTRGQADYAERHYV